ncbi:hypothetical protein [uncultured Pseudokineococcus sp.]|uniref:hypothetical protein n=1 Tax=uncultured Pseudokineococcus sp. TaxID=1642928 RepID=UPI002616EFD7|nr:hypothetical protein [uncultured Pseudokineococcus sp.]
MEDRPAFVLTVDQRGSRRAEDAVPALLERLARLAPQPLRPFERTAGDEVQGVLDDPVVVVAVVLALADEGHWSTGVGVGPVRRPLPASTRAGAGPAFEAARAAVTAAKGVREGVALRGPGGPDGPSGTDGPPGGPLEDAGPGTAVLDAETALLLLVGLRARRSGPGREAVALAERGLGPREAAQHLGVSPQAVSQRLRAAAWSAEERTRPLAARLLARAARTAVETA